MGSLIQREAVGAGVGGGPAFGEAGRPCGKAGARSQPRSASSVTFQVLAEVWAPAAPARKWFDAAEQDGQPKEQQPGLSTSNRCRHSSAKRAGSVQRRGALLSAGGKPGGGALFAPLRAESRCAYSVGAPGDSARRRYAEDGASPALQQGKVQRSRLARLPAARC